MITGVGIYDVGAVIIFRQRLRVLSRFFEGPKHSFRPLLLLLELDIRPVLDVLSGEILAESLLPLLPTLQHRCC